MNILDLHVNCQVALHPKQLENLDSNHWYGYRSNSILKENSSQNSIKPNMDYEETAFKHQPYKRTSANESDLNTTNYQNSSLYNMYDKWHYYSVNPGADRYGSNEYPHSGIIPLGHGSYTDHQSSSNYMEDGYRRYASDFYEQMYDQQLPVPESGFYPYSSNFNSYLNFCDNGYHQPSTSYYQQKSRYQIPESSSYQNLHDSVETGWTCERKPDTNNSHWYSLPTYKTVNTTSNRDFYQNYDARQTFSSSGNSQQKQNGYSDRNIKVSPHLYDYEQKHTIQHGKSNRQNGIGKGPSNFTLHVRKQERKLKKRLKELQSKNCEKATQLQEYYHYKVIMIEKQAKQQEQESMLSTIENNEETDVQILQLVREMEERINALQFTLNEDTSVKYGQICSEARKTRLLPKHAIKTLENWYEDNLSNPYPSRDQTVRLALDCGLSIEQVRKWFANKRNRSRNNKLHLLK